MLFKLNALPEEIFGRYYQPGTTTPDTTSVIYKMVNTVGGGKYQSLFDKDGTEEDKKKVHVYIAGILRPSTSVQPVLEQNLYGGAIFNDVTYNGPITKGTEVKLDLGTYM